MSRPFLLLSIPIMVRAHHSNRTIFLDFRTSLNLPFNAGHSTSGTKDHFLICNSLTKTGQQLQSLFSKNQVAALLSRHTYKFLGKKNKEL